MYAFIYYWITLIVQNSVDFHINFSCSLDIDVTIIEDLISTIVHIKKMELSSDIYRGVQMHLQDFFFFFFLTLWFVFAITEDMWNS